MVHHGSSWFVVVRHGSSWFVVVRHGSRDVSRWFVMIHIPFHYNL